MDGADITVPAKPASRQIAAHRIAAVKVVQPDTHIQRVRIEIPDFHNRNARATQHLDRTLTVRTPGDNQADGLPREHGFDPFFFLIAGMLGHAKHCLKAKGTQFAVNAFQHLRKDFVAESSPKQPFFDGIKKQFGGTYALREVSLNDVSLNIERGEIVALLGEHGAGKSLVAIARALAVDCDFLVLDEPTASLPADEVERLFQALRPLKAQGVGMIYVSHRLDEIFRIADRVAVLRDGEMAGLRNIDHTTPEELGYMIVGRKTRQVMKANVALGEPILWVKNMHVHHSGPVGPELRQNELLGLVGQRGAGHIGIAGTFWGSAF